MSATSSPLVESSRRLENAVLPEILVRLPSDSSSNSFATLNTPNKLAQISSDNNSLTSVKTYFANTLGPSVLVSCSVNFNNSNILNNNMNQSALFVNVKELNLQLYSEVIVSWNILEETSIHDFIGIYKLGKLIILIYYCSKKIAIYFGKNFKM